MKTATSSVAEQYITHAELEDGLEEKEESLAEWMEMVTAYEADQSCKNPYEFSVTHPTQHAVRRELADEEKKTAGTGADFSLSDAVSPSGLIAWGLDLEGEQCVQGRFIRVPILISSMTDVRSNGYQTRYGITLETASFQAPSTVPTPSCGRSKLGTASSSYTFPALRSSVRETPPTPLAHGIYHSGYPLKLVARLPSTTALLTLNTGFALAKRMKLWELCVGIFSCEPPSMTSRSDGCVAKGLTPVPSKQSRPFKEGSLRLETSIERPARLSSPSGVYSRSPMFIEPSQSS